MQKKTKLFAGFDYYPEGGYKDFVAYFASIEAAKEYVETTYKQEDCMWAHIVCDGKIVLNGDIDSWISDEWEWYE